MASGTPSLRRGVRRDPVGWALLALGIAATLAWVVFAVAGGPRTAQAAPAMPVDAGRARGPVELTSIRLVQKDVRMALQIATGGTWSAKDVADTDGREICVTLVHGAPSIPRGRVCVTRRNAKPALNYTPLGTSGKALPTRPLAAVVRRPTQLGSKRRSCPSPRGCRWGVTHGLRPADGPMSATASGPAPIACPTAAWSRGASRC